MLDILRSLGAELDRRAEAGEDDLEHAADRTDVTARVSAAGRPDGGTTR